MGILSLLTLYPLVWFFTVELNVISLDWEMWIYANLDISAKLLLTSVLSNLTAAAYDYDVGKYRVLPACKLEAIRRHTMLTSIMW